MDLGAAMGAMGPVIPNFVPLYLVIGLWVAYLVIMAAVTGSFTCCKRALPGESEPLKAVVVSKPARPAARFGSFSYSDAPPELGSAATVDGYIRAGFVRKVYSILSTQLLLTVTLVVIWHYASFESGDAHHLTPFGLWMIRHGFHIQWLVLILALVTLCSLMSYKNSYPYNLVGLAVFTVEMSFFVSTTCVTYHAAGYGQAMLLALVITTATFLALTAFTIFSEIDFTFLAPVLCLGVFVVLMWSCIMSIAFAFGGWSFSWTLVFTIMVALLFIGFIVFDTYQIVTRLGVDDYLIAAVELYLDVINLFFVILSLLTLCGRR